MLDKADEKYKILNEKYEEAKRNIKGCREEIAWLRDGEHVNTNEHVHTLPELEIELNRIIVNLRKEINEKDEIIKSLRNTVLSVQTFFSEGKNNV